MKLIYEGHACFNLITDQTNVLIDPYLSANQLAVHKPEDMHPDLILVTHSHRDHLGDALAIAQATGATIAGSVELMSALPDIEGLKKMGIQSGGSFQFQDVRVRMTPAWHGGGSLEKNGTLIYTGLACGFIIQAEGKTIYHAGDTALFGDMSMVISRYGLDCALLPIGDYYTMGPEDALTAVEWLKAKMVIPMHYNTFPPIKQDPQAFAQKVKETTDSDCLPLQPGEEYIL